MTVALLYMFFKLYILNYLVWCCSVFKSYEPCIGVSKVFMNIGSPCFYLEQRATEVLTFKDFQLQICFYYTSFQLHVMSY